MIKKIIVITTLLSATLLAIGVPVVLVSSNNDIQSIKNAKEVLQKLTTNQKTVNLTKDSNQKLPSLIGPTITSMKALNNLLKEPIIMLSGIIYIPKIIKFNDDKGEIVIQIKIKKKTIIWHIDTFIFTISRFRTIKQVNQDAIIGVLDKINKDTINGDENKLPSEMTTKLIKALVGFPKEIDDMYFKPTVINNHDDIKGTLTTTLIATKKESSKTKEIVISGFKTIAQAQSQIDKAYDILNKFKNTETTTKDKFAIEVKYSNLNDFFIKTKLPMPNKNDQAILNNVNIKIKEYVMKDSMSQDVELTISKIGGITKNSYIKIVGFESPIQVQTQINDAIGIFEKLMLFELDIKILDNTQLSNDVKYVNWRDLFAKTTLPMPNKNDQAILDNVNIEVIIPILDKATQEVKLDISKIGGDTRVIWLNKITGFRE